MHENLLQVLAETLRLLVLASDDVYDGLHVTLLLLELDK